MTLSLAKYYIDKFKTTELSRLSRLERYYKNDNDINRRQFQDTSKPNNKISHSFADYITTTNTAMFLGSPVSYNSADILDNYNEVLINVGEEDANINLATNCSIYGYGTQLLYLDENAEVKFALLDNKQVVLIYSDDISAKLLYCIRFWDVMTVENVSNSYIEIYSTEGVQRYKNDTFMSEDSNVFCDIPVVVYKNNDQLKGDFEKVISIIDAYDMLESDSVNENDYFNNAYLFLNTDSVDLEDIKAMKENRVLYGTELNPAFILKNSQNADNDIEKNRLVSDIHKLSFTPDMSDNNFANNVSGVAMKYKLLGTLNIIANKQRKFKIALQERNKLLFDIMSVKSLTPPSYVDIVFTTSLPENSLETAQTINQLRGLVSDETLVSQLPFVQDAAWEVEQAKAANTVTDIYGGGSDE
jgi:SPP1 family phage portal protein